MKAILLFLLCFSCLPACVTVSSISTSQIPPAAARKQKVAASASNLVVLLIPFGNSFVERAREDLERQCPNGAIEGIQAKHQNTNYFLGLAVAQEVVMQGYCINARKKG
jgi:curli biogenesis system outer membrane secretion channel CsgG